MPEGPEIRRAADRIEQTLRGETLKAVELHVAGLGDHARTLVGGAVTAVDTRGKAMLTRFDCGLSLYSHNQLYGVWYVVPAGGRPRTGRALRVGLHTTRASALLYSATDVALLTHAEELEHPFLCRIGPDILDRRLTAADIAQRLDSPRFRNRALAGLYLDQSFIAGIGNYLRSEILHFARVHPKARPADLDRNARNRLARQTLAVTWRSYRSGGVTNLAGRARDMLRAGADFEDRRFAAYARAGRRCYRCDRPIRRASLATRAVFWCAACQPLPRRA